MLERAERKIGRARLNGVDDPNIYYSEAVLLTLRSQPERALEKLVSAYDRGWREYWVMEIDTRLEPLYEQPDFISLKNRIRDDLNQALAEIRSQPLASL